MASSKLVSRLDKALLTYYRNNNRPVDLSRTFRQTGLSSGAKLELVVASRSPSVVSIALQLPQSLASAVPGGRLMDKFPSDTTLWLILRKFESNGGSNLNFTARGITEIQSGTSGAGRIFYEMPVLNIMGRELSTFGDLQKTLGQLGFNGGSALIRLDFKKTEQPLEEAMAEIGQYFKESAPGDSSATKADMAPGEELETVTSAIARLPSAEPTYKEQSSAAVQGTTEGASADPADSITPLKRPAPLTPEELLGPDQRPIAVYSAPSSHTPKAALQPHNDSDYEPTIAHAKLHQSRLQTSSQNKRLLSDAENEKLEKEQVARSSAAKEVSIKIRFPDQASIVSPFKADETGADLYKYVIDVIVGENEPFKLVWTNKGPHTVPKDGDKKLIKDLGFEGRMLVNFLWEDGASETVRKQPVLKPQFAQSAKELTVPEPPVGEEDQEAGRTSTMDKGKEKETGSSGEKSKSGMPKWFKGIGKK